jgi:hypothetical protein
MLCSNTAFRISKRHKAAINMKKSFTSKLDVNLRMKLVKCYVKSYARVTSRFSLLNPLSYRENRCNSTSKCLFWELCKIYKYVLWKISEPLFFSQLAHEIIKRLYWGLSKNINLSLTRKWKEIDSFNFESLAVSLRITGFNIQKFYTVLVLRWVLCTDLWTRSDLCFIRH